MASEDFFVPAALPPSACASAASAGVRRAAAPLPVRSNSAMACFVSGRSACFAKASSLLFTSSRLGPISLSAFCAPTRTAGSLLISLSIQPFTVRSRWVFGFFGSAYSGKARDGRRDHHGVLVPEVLEDGVECVDRRRLGEAREGLDLLEAARLPAAEQVTLGQLPEERLLLLLAMGRVRSAGLGVGRAGEDAGAQEALEELGHLG